MRLAFIPIVLTFAALSFAQTPDPKLNQFTVNGSVEIRQIADQGTLHFSLKGVGSTLREAVENAEKKTKSVVVRLRSLGVKEKNVSTSDFYSGENNGDKAFLSSSRDYRAVITTFVTVDSLKLLQEVIFAVSESDPENLSRVSFSLKDEVPLRRRARVEAGRKAREKADDIAKALGITIGRVLMIEEMPTLVTYPGQSIRGGMLAPVQFNSIPNPFNPVSSGSMEEQGVADETQGSGFFAQTISIASQVRVTFEIK